MIMRGLMKLSTNPYPHYFLFLENHVNELIIIPQFKIGWTTNGLKNCPVLKRVGAFKIRQDHNNLLGCWQITILQLSTSVGRKVLFWWSLWKSKLVFYSSISKSQLALRLGKREVSCKELCAETEITWQAWRWGERGEPDTWRTWAVACACGG